MLRKEKSSAPKMPYQDRIRHYNQEKQSALLLATTQEEVERVIYILRKKWAV